MKTTLRFVALTAALSVAIWGGPARTSHAELSCDGPFPTPCQIGETLTCSEGFSTRTCECVYFGGHPRWLCYW